MSKKPISKSSRRADVPYPTRSRRRVRDFWKGATAHIGIEGFRRARGRPPSEQRKVAISLRLDPDVLEAWRATGPGWQTRMAEALKRAV